MLKITKWKKNSDFQYDFENGKLRKNKQNKLIKKGDLVINVASMPAQEKGMTNMMKISKA